MTFKFKREPESGLILVNVEVDNKFELKMILDTGATNTTIDSNAMYLLCNPYVWLVKVPC
jgi:predicted aspartyl protease